MSNAIPIKKPTNRNAGQTLRLPNLPIRLRVLGTVRVLGTELFGRFGDRAIWNTGGLGTELFGMQEVLGKDVT